MAYELGGGVLPGGVEPSTAMEVGDPILIRRVGRTRGANKRKQIGKELEEIVHATGLYRELERVASAPEPRARKIGERTGALSRGGEME